MRRIAMFIAAMVVVVGLSGCADIFIMEAISPRSADISAPHHDSNATIQSEKSILYLRLLSDNRSDKEITRAISGPFFQEKIVFNTPQEVPLFLTRAIQDKLASKGVATELTTNATATPMISGTIESYNLSFSAATWRASVNINLVVDPGNSAWDYRIKKDVSKFNWNGLNTGVGALEEALRGALDQLPVEQLAQLAQQH